jgi:hypothetical protein
MNPVGLRGNVDTVVDEDGHPVTAETPDFAEKAAGGRALEPELDHPDAPPDRVDGTLQRTHRGIRQQNQPDVAQRRPAPRRAWCFQDRPHPSAGMAPGVSATKPVTRHVST